MKGGCYPAMMLMKQLERFHVPSRVDFIWINSTHDHSTVGAAKYPGGPQSSLESETVILVDDLVESGRTLSQAVEICSNHKPTKLEVAVVFEKKGVARHPRAANLHLNYVGLPVPNKVVFGGLCMDYNENLRSYPDVYVMKRHHKLPTVLIPR